MAMRKFLLMTQLLEFGLERNEQQGGEENYTMIALNYQMSFNLFGIYMKRSSKKDIENSSNMLRKMVMPMFLKDI